MTSNRVTRRRRWALSAVASLAALVGAPAAAMAQTPVLTPDLPPAAASPTTSTVVLAPGQHTRRLTIPTGKSLIVDLPSDASEVFVGNPAVANAIVRSARRLYVMAVGNGQTTIFALDKQGHQIAALEFVIVGRDLGDLKSILDTAIPGNEIVVKGIDDTVILTGSVASAVEAQRAYDIASAYVGYSSVGGGSASSSGSGSSINFGGPQIINGKLINSLVIRGQDQVMLKVSVVEIRRDIVKQLGVATNGTFGTTSVSNYFSPSAASNLGGYIGPTPTGYALGGAGSGISGKYGSLQAALQAFERNGVAHVLAEPTVTAISGETAQFTAGGTLPISTQSSIDPKTGICTVSTALQPYGVTLNFTPTVLSEGRISLHLAAEVTEPDGTNAAQYACSNQVGFRTRKNTTTVELPSGGSIVSAGLIERSSTQAISGTPGLMNLPILGALFRSRDYQRDESELMIIVTPYLVKALRSDQVSKPDDGFTDATDPQSWLLGRVNKIYSTADNPVTIQNYRGRVGFIAD
ncbi:MAG TPA: type II and III secretion system protein family protein [Lichenihabitans sp.]|jgi:pilus assembly protein CpaC|nr:type II and III secretion system protein family protein [Lichenihabitans sp.]